MTNLTTLDIFGVALGTVAFAAILLSPGYLLAWSFNFFAFRQLSLLERLAWANGLSFAIVPILTELAGRVVPVQAIAGACALAALATLVLLFLPISGERPSLRVPVDRSTLLLALFLLFGASVIVFELIDIQQGSRLFLSVTVVDQGFRVAFINAIAHGGIPPHNPLYHPGMDSPMRYYYFWYAVCAVCVKLAGISARQALIASSVWVGFGLVAAIALFAKHFFKVREHLTRFLLVSSLLLTVTGLDIMPVLYNLFVHHDFSGDLEWWSRDQISSWLDSILWVPNHVAALLACLAAFLLLWRTRDGAARRDSIPAALLAGCAAASAFGMSVYVAAGFAMLMLGWTAILWLREHDLGLVRRNAVTFCTATVLIIPYLRELAATHSGTEGRSSAGPAHLFQISVRAMIDPDLITSLPVLATVHRTHPMLLDQAVRLLLLIPGYALELGASGFVFLLALLALPRLARPQKTALVLAAGGLFVVSFLRSSVIGNNDFGYRAALLPSFFLLLLTADFLVGVLPRVQSQVIAILLLIGLMGTAFQALMLRVFVPLHVAAGMPQFAHLPERAFAARTAYARAAEVIPESALVQPNPVNPRDYLSAVNLLYSERPMATDAEVDCGAVFGGDPALCADTQRAVAELFLAPSPSATEAFNRCRKLGIRYLAVAEKDMAWQDRSGWVWTLPVVVDVETGTAKAPESARARFRILDCDKSPKTVP